MTPRCRVLIRNRLRDEKGMALILAVGMLAIFSLLGFAVHEVASRDVRSSAVFRAQESAFYAAERAVEYALNRDMLLTMGAGIDLKTGTHPASINAGSTKASGGGELDLGSVNDAGPGEMPIKLKAKYGSDFGANYYYITVKGIGPEETEAEIDTQVVRLFKRDDDNIFRTTGGG